MNQLFFSQKKQKVENIDESKILSQKNFPDVILF